MSKGYHFDSKGYLERWRFTPKGRASTLCSSVAWRTKKKPSKKLQKKVERAIVRGVCALCGLKMDLLNRRLTLSPSLDKVDPKKGYTVANTQVVHYICNRIKGEFPQEFIRPHIKSIMESYYGHLS